MNKEKKNVYKLVKVFAIGFIMSSTNLHAIPIDPNEITGARNGSLTREKVIQVETSANYLSRWDASEQNITTGKLLRKYLRTTRPIVMNYGANVNNAQGRFDDIKRLYSIGKYYQNRRYYVAAKAEYTVAWQMMRELVREFERVYRNRLLDLISKTAYELTDRDIEVNSQLISAIQVPPKYIEKNDYKLRIANYHLDEGARNKFLGRYMLAIDHYRVGKVFAISAMEGLEIDSAKRDQIRNEYRADLRDARKLLINPPQPVQQSQPVQQ